MSAWSHVGATCAPAADASEAWEWSPPAGWTAGRLAWLVRRWGWLSERCAIVPRISSSKGPALELLAGPGGAPYAPGPAALARTSALLGQLDRALRACDLQLALSAKDLWVDARGQPWVFGLAGLRRGLGSPGVPEVANTLTLLGGSEPQRDFAATLASWRKEVWPETLAAWKRAAERDAMAELAPPEVASWESVRGASVHSCWTDEARGLTIFAEPAPTGSPGGAWWALDRGDQLRLLIVPEHGDAQPDQVRARREAFRQANPAAGSGWALDAALLRSLAPECRSGEPFVLAPPPALPRPALPPPVPAAPRLRAAVGPGGDGVELNVEDLPEGTTGVVFLRCDDPDVLLTPDGAAILADVPVEELPFFEAEPSERFAVFPRCGEGFGPPAFASFWGGPEVEQLDLEPGIGSIAVRWKAPAQALVELHADGKLAHTAQGPGEWTHDCLDAGQRVSIEARISLGDGSCSPGLAGSAVALGPPPRLGDVEAEGGNSRVVVRWTWPAEEGYELVLVEREPPFADGPRKVRRESEPEFVDLDVDPGQTYRYQLRSAWGEVVSVHHAEAAGVPWAELERVVAEPAGGAVWLRWSLPRGVGLDAAEVVLVRNLERPPRDLEDGERLEVKGTEHLDQALPVGAEVHYRASLRLASSPPSPGVLVQAKVREPAGAMGRVEVESGQGALELKITPPSERCEAIHVFAGPAEGELEQVAALQVDPGGAPLSVKVRAVPGVVTRLRVVPCQGGEPDQGKAVELQATAWDDLSDLVAPARANAVELRWTPPATAPSGYMVRRIQLGRSEETREWKLPSDATSFVDESAQARLKYAYRIACLWAGGGPAEDHEVEVTALAEPPELPKAELRVQAGSVAIRYLPVPASARLRFTGSVVYTSARPIADLEALFAELPCFDRAQAESLGLVEVALRQRSKRKEVIRCDPPPPGTVSTYVLASLNQQLARPVLVAPGLGLGEGFASIASRTEPAGIHLSWTWPEWLRSGSAELTSLTLERGLDEVPQSLVGEDLDTLSAPWSTELPLNACEYEDREALSYLTWGYRLSLSLSVGVQSFTLTGPRHVVPPTPGGTLRLTAKQPRGIFGTKSRVDLEVSCPAPRWPEFRIVRVVGNQQAGKAIAQSPEGAPSRNFVDEDLGNFSAGTRLRYRLELAKERDRLGFEVSEAEVELG